MKILIINSGSSSLKFQLMNTATGEVLEKGACERIGIAGSFIKYESAKGKNKIEIEIPSHNAAIQLTLNALKDEKLGVVSDLNEIDAIGHRMVHGGEVYTESILVDETIMKNLEKLIPLAPLHMPANIMGIKACMEILPGKKNVAVFDTAFHSTMPEVAYMYAIGYDMYEKYRLRRYGFHGSSHRFIAEKMKTIYGKLEGKKIISCHLGNGSSISAIKDGKCVDTSMGYTPLAGLVMGTRCGDIDPALVKAIMDNTGKTIDETTTYLNKECGLQGISGFTSDMRDIENNLDNKNAKLAYDMLCYSIKKYIGSYSAVLGGVDAIVFTGGIGENCGILRRDVLKGLEYLGIDFDENKNDTIARGTEEKLSTSQSKVDIYRIPTDEEYIIATDTERLVK